MLAENFYKVDNYKKAKKVYTDLSKYGEAYNWYSSKQLARILLQDKKKKEKEKLLKNSYNK